MAKKQAAREADVIDLGFGDTDAVVEQEQVATRTDGETIREWLRGVVEFFATARTLEKAAKTTLELARKLTPPTTQRDDERMQEFAKQASVDKKSVEEHWNVCQMISTLHRRLTAARARATEPLEQAAGIANRLHADYAETERRRAAEEQERIRRDREEQARLERQRELDRLELDAVRAEEAAATLSEREQAFVDAYTSNVAGWKGNGERSAQVAQFKNPREAAVRLLALEKIRTAIDAKEKAAAIRQQAAAKAQQPLEVRAAVVTPRLGRGVGVRGTVTTWSGEVLDEPATMQAFLAGKHGIPADLWQINPAKLNEYARAMQERLDLWPGVRAVKKTSVR